jgi:hypothetical protein
MFHVHVHIHVPAHVYVDVHVHVCTVHERVQVTYLVQVHIQVYGSS